MADHENENQNEEEMEEEILINQEEGEGEGQDFYAIEMQINDEPYLIVIGKTEENKIFLRLMNKEDQNKPFFHNEFSLEDLKNINPIFNGIESEDIAFQYLVSNLNDAEKDVKIIDEEKINFSIIITDEEEKLEFDFILIKSIDDGNGENEMEEEGIEEMINEVVDDINEETGENNEVSEQREKEKNIPIKKEEKEKKEKKEEKEEKEEEKEEIIINKEDKKEDEDDILKIINSLNENFNNQIDKQNQNLENMKKELTEQNNKKIKEIKDELNKKDNEIIELKNTINNLQQKLSEYENNKPLKSSNKKNELNNNIDTNKIMNEVKGNMKGFDNKISEIKNIIEKDKKEKENNINKLTEKINNIENKIPKNKIKENDNNKIIALENGLKSLDAKLNNFENMAILLEKQNDDNKVYEIINTLGEEMNEIKQKLNKKEKDKNLNNNKNKNKSDPEILNKIKNNENNISLLQTKLNKIQEIKQKDNDDKKKINNIIKTSNDLVTKIDALFNHIKKLENENKELNNKITKLSSSKQIPQINAKKIIPKSNTNYYHTLENNQNQENQSSFYNRTNPNLNNINISKDSINSRIVNYEDIIFIQNRIKEINPRIKDVYFSLVYRATEDGDKAVNFHNKCDKIGPNIVLIKTKKGFIFGGFTFRNWEHLPRDIDINRPNLGSASRDANAFGFNINNQKIYNNERPNEFAIWCNRNFGPTFKNNLFQIFDSCLKKGGYCTVRRSSHFGGQKTDFEITGGESKFKVDELEVFEVKLEC